MQQIAKLTDTKPGLLCKFGNGNELNLWILFELLKERKIVKLPKGHPSPEEGGSDFSIWQQPGRRAVAELRSVRGYE